MGSTHESIEDQRNQEILIYVNGQMYAREEAKVSVYDSAFLVGDGVWESFRLHNGKPAFVRQHLERLNANLKSLDYDLGMPVSKLMEAVDRTIRANKMISSDVHIRMMISRGNKRTPSQDPRANVGGPTVVVIAEYKQRKEADNGLEVFTVHVRRGSPDVQDPKLHTHSKLNCILACIQATQAGADEALMLDPHGFVSTCNSTNFFIVKAGQVWTSTGKYCLNGITRGNVIEICKRHDIPVFEKDFSLYDVYSADEAFVTGTFGGLGFVAALDGREIGDGQMGPLTGRLRGLYAELLDEECPAEPLA